MAQHSHLFSPPRQQKQHRTTCVSNHFVDPISIVVALLTHCSHEKYAAKQNRHISSATSKSPTSNVSPVGVGVGARVVVVTLAHHSVAAHRNADEQNKSCIRDSQKCYSIDVSHFQSPYVGRALQPHAAAVQAAAATPLRRTETSSDKNETLFDSIRSNLIRADESKGAVGRETARARAIVDDRCRRRRRRRWRRRRRRCWC